MDLWWHAYISVGMEMFPVICIQVMMYTNQANKGVYLKRYCIYYFLFVWWKLNTIFSQEKKEEIFPWLLWDLLGTCDLVPVYYVWIEKIESFEMKPPLFIWMTKLKLSSLSSSLQWKQRAHSPSSEFYLSLSLYLLSLSLHLYKLKQKNVVFRARQQHNKPKP